MTRSGPLARWPLPDVVYPTKTRCFQVEVPDDIHYIGAFYGAMYSLTQSNRWAQDSAHTAAKVSRVWGRIFDRLLAGECVPDSKINICESDYEMSICEQLRFHNGVLQGYCCGEWVNISGQPPGGIGAGGQPGDGSQQPAPGGGCQTYHGKMGANLAWYVPTVVNSGDTINITNPGGAWNDGAEIAWRCWNGGTFFAGNCTGITALSGSDPLPTVPHMAMLALINGTYYDLTAGPLTIPGGVVNAQVLLVPNDSTPSDDPGTIEFDITVCNNQAGSWTSLLDFTINPYASFVGGVFASWAMGTGYQGVVNGGVPNWAQLDITLDSCAIDMAEMVYDALTPGGGSNVVFFQENGGGYGTPGTTVAGASEIYNVTQSVSAVTLFQAIVSTGTTGGVDHIQSLRLTGRGPKPSQLP